MKQVVSNHSLVGAFVAAHAKCAFNPESDTTLGVVDDSYSEGSPGWIRGGVIYTSYTGTSLWTHVAGSDEHWITRDMLWAAFHYPFEQLGCGVIFGVVEEANTHTLEFDLKLGYRVMASLPGMFASGAGLIVSMRREDCRWLRLRPRTLKEGSSHGW